MIFSGHIRIGVTLLVLALFAGPARSENVATLEGLVHQWVDLRSEIAESNRSWTEQEAALRQEVALLKEEQSRLQATLEAEAGQREADLTDRTELAARRDAQNAVLDRVFEALGDAGDSGLPVARRVQQRLTELAERDALHHSIQVSREVVETGTGIRKEVTVLRLGLARAFAVSDANDWAAVGNPSAESWAWTPRPELASEIRRAIAVHTSAEPAAFVKLPLQAGEVAE